MGYKNKSLKLEQRFYKNIINDYKVAHKGQEPPAHLLPIMKKEAHKFYEVHIKTHYRPETENPENYKRPIKDK